MRRFAPRLLTGAATGALLGLPAMASARVQVTPYIEVQQVLDGTLAGDAGNQDVVTYTTLSAGVDGSASGRVVEGSFSYRYEHLFGETKGLGDQDGHYGLLRGSVTAVPIYSPSRAARSARAHATTSAAPRQRIDS